MTFICIGTTAVLDSELVKDVFFGNSLQYNDSTRNVLKITIIQVLQLEFSFYLSSFSLGSFSFCVARYVTENLNQGDKNLALQVDSVMEGIDSLWCQM